MEQIRIDLQVAERTADILARRHIAVLAVGLTTSLTAMGAAVLGHAALVPAVLVGAAGAVVVATQLRALGALVRGLELARRTARMAIERLIGMEGDTDVDASPQA